MTNENPKRMTKLEIRSGGDRRAAYLRRRRRTYYTTARILSRCAAGYVFTVGSRCVAAANLAAVEGGILPPRRGRQIANAFPDYTPFPPGRMPGSTAGKMPAATVNRYAAGGGPGAP